jgi:DMSO/TMAO reductase YedYZ heme-binding membrane subunit
VPFVVGALLGIVAAIVIVHVAIGHLDTLRNLEPPAHVIVDLGSMATALAVGVVALLVLAALGTVTSGRIRPMEAMRSAE